MKTLSSSLCQNLLTLPVTQEEKMLGEFKFDQLVFVT